MSGLIESVPMTSVSCDDDFGVPDAEYWCFLDESGTPDYDPDSKPYFAFGSAEDHYKYRDAVKEAYPEAHFPVFAGYDHMQYQICDPEGFAAMLRGLAERDVLRLPPEASSEQEGEKSK